MEKAFGHKLGAYQTIRNVETGVQWVLQMRFVYIDTRRPQGHYVQ
jgi:hypothetical protein